MTHEELVSARRPRDVVDAAGAWIGDGPAAHGFRWLAAGRSVQRLAGGLVQQIVLQPSSVNRTGKEFSTSTHVGIRLAATAGAATTVNCQEGVEVDSCPA